MPTLTIYRFFRHGGRVSRFADVRQVSLAAPAAGPPLARTSGGRAAAGEDPHRSGGVSRGRGRGGGAEECAWEAPCPASPTARRSSVSCASFSERARCIGNEQPGRADVSFVSHGSAFFIAAPVAMRRGFHCWACFIAVHTIHPVADAHGALAAPCLPFELAHACMLVHVRRCLCAASPPAVAGT